MPRRSIIIAVRGRAARVATATAWVGRSSRGRRDVEGTGTTFVLERGSDFRVPRLDVFEQFPGDQASGPCGRTENFPYSTSRRFMPPPSCSLPSALRRRDLLLAMQISRSSCFL